jgi:hypothetical protein
VKLPLLTSSRCSTWRRCQREHRYRYELGIVPREDQEALRFGSLVHAGLEAWWLGMTPERRAAGVDGAERLVCAFEAMRDYAIKTRGLTDYDLVAAEELLLGYDVRWGDEPYETIAVEKEFEVPLVDPLTGMESQCWRLGGKLDVIARRTTDGATVFFEHKTSSSDIEQGSSYWARLKLDGQVSVYFRGADALGYDATECVYDVLGKVGLKPLAATPLESRKYTKTKVDKKTGEIKEPSRLYAGQREEDESLDEFRERVRGLISENPDKFYQRGPVVRLESEMLEHDAEMWELARQMHASQSGVAPRNPDQCRRYSSICSYFAVCSGEGSLEDSRFRRIEWVHPELEMRRAEAG